MVSPQGVREKVHLPIYDSLRVEAKKQLVDVETSSILKFFVNSKGKTKLETNVSLFSKFKGFEAHAMRVVISDLPPEFPVDVTLTATGLVVTDRNGVRLDGKGHREPLQSDRHSSDFDATN